MEFLKEILGDDLFDKISEAINSWNGNEANKEKQVKLANLSGGEYVGKGKYDALTESLKGKDAELSTANKLIEELKKGTKGDDELQGKITTYESQIKTLQEENAEIKLKSAIKVALLSENAVDVDYLTYKLHESLKEKGESLELDENDNIKGWEDRIKGLKAQFPSMFDSKGRTKKFEENRLPEGDEDRDTEPTSLAQAIQMEYEEE
ncbi:phage scaffolding protein [Emergencia sp. 1XD21-10]|uniref:phage scaffolding protein n=1 Tax=Emergencia sp. 1XD21-10 TaxID=2304569 RepID=UPI00137B133A|nr:phage scaffolding protein [Emergencia sp. 1XD21-10]NCE98408.1 hypothetical protein [Emergencia sp. 1XD21-10]